MPDSPLFILLPGMHGTEELFGRLIKAAPPGVQTRIIAYPSDASMRFTDYVAYVRERLPIDRDYVIVAESFAGPIAITLAGEKPSGLQGLVLCNTFTRRPGSHAFLLLPLTAICSLSLPQWMCRRYLSGSDRLDNVQVSTNAADRKTPPDVYAARLRIALKTDVTDIFQALDLPILCLLGKRDRLIKPKPMQRLAEAHPRAEHVWIDAPHMILQSHTTASWDAITAFAARATTNPPARPSARSDDAG